MKLRAISVVAAAILAMLFVAESAIAQQPATIARVTGIQGSVLVSQGNAMVPAVEGQRLPEGARIVTAVGSKVTVVNDAGCEVPLTGNQRFTVRKEGCVCTAPAAVAALTPEQRNIGRLSELEGNVLVSRADAMTAAASGQRLASGTRVVTTAGAKVTIAYDYGCDVRLGENEQHSIRYGCDCAAIANEVVALGPAPGAIGGGPGGAVTGSTGFGNIAIVGVPLLLGVGVYEIVKQNSRSPN